MKKKLSTNLYFLLSALCEYLKIPLYVKYQGTKKMGIHYFLCL